MLGPIGLQASYTCFRPLIVKIGARTRELFSVPTVIFMGPPITVTSASVRFTAWALHSRSAQSQLAYGASMRSTRLRAGLTEVVPDSEISYGTNRATSMAPLKQEERAM